MEKTSHLVNFVVAKQTKINYMHKSTKKSGHPVISQLLNLLDKSKINRTAIQYKSDRYYKTFVTHDHLITMLYSVISGCNSLREITGIMLACEGRINHLGIKSFPKRSTLSDANRKRISAVFGEIYFEHLKKYRSLISDSSIKSKYKKDLLIIDSTTISLFCNILKGVGRTPINGKKKGGIKMHTMINASEDVPTLVRFSSAATHDSMFLQKLKLQPGSIVVFDKGYNDYLQYLQWSLDGVYFVTRIKDNAAYKSIEEYDIPDEVSGGVIKDEKIELTKNDKSISLRRIAYWDEKNKRVFEFITNNYELSADTIAAIYKQRWQIELLFKRLKQNFPLKYFLGDSRNAIEIQIWVSLLAQLLLMVIRSQTTRKWAFSNLMSIVRFHLMTYINLIKFLNNPNSSWESLKTIKDQLQLFNSS